MDTRAVPGAADAAVYKEAHEAWLALLQAGQVKAFVAEAVLAKHLPDDKVLTGTVDDLPYDRLPAFLDDCRATLGAAP